MLKLVHFCQYIKNPAKNTAHLKNDKGTKGERRLGSVEQCVETQKGQGIAGTLESKLRRFEKTLLVEVKFQSAKRPLKTRKDLRIAKTLNRK